MSKTMLQLYGQFAGYWSHSQVSRGMAYGLLRQQIPVQIYNTNRYGGYEGLSEALNQGGYNVSLPSGWQSTQVGLFVGGYPEQISPWLDEHAYKVAMLICESEVLPQDWAARARRCDLIIVPSSWVKKAYVSAGVPPDKVHVVHHGIHPIFAQRRVFRRDATPLQFLHISGAADFLERKGTMLLLEAFRRVFHVGEHKGKAELTIRTPASPAIFSTLAGYGGYASLDASLTAMNPAEMALYLHGFNCVVQPSRAEAFGIVPVEARAIGLPVIVTHCSGHQEHAEKTDLVVQHEAHSEPMRAQGIRNGLAPVVTVEAIEQALRAFMANPQHHVATAAAAAVGYAEQWLWPVRMMKLAALLRPKLRRQGMSTLNEKLGL